MIPVKKVEELILRHKNLEGDLSSGNIDKKLFAIKSKEYSDLNEIINQARKYLNFEPALGGDKIISLSALSLLLFVSIVAPSSFHISYTPPISSPIDRAGGPSILITDLPLSLCPVTILLT